MYYYYCLVNLENCRKILKVFKKTPFQKKECFGLFWTWEPFWLWLWPCRVHEYNTKNQKSRHKWNSLALMTPATNSHSLFFFPFASVGGSQSLYSRKLYKIFQIVEAVYRISKRIPKIHLKFENSCVSESFGRFRLSISTRMSL